MTKNDRILKRLSCSFIVAQILFVATLFLPGCLPGSKPPLLVDQYTIEYAPPQGLNGPPIADTIRIDRFSVAQAYNNTSMVYRPGPYKVAVYTYNRWRVNPGDMVTDHLTRDFRASGIFQGVFSYRELQEARFVLEGGIEEFLETDEQGAASALISVRAALIDTSQRDTARKLVFQKSYRVTEPMDSRSPEALARSMSLAARKMSEQILKDVSEAVKGLNG